ncbi:MAG TPA: nucleoside hydrolase [Anaerolineaceae bacterium]|nr:nucleoside hydrolase [Anaerolineaceae bacterium]
MIKIIVKLYHGFYQRIIEKESTMKRIVIDCDPGIDDAQAIMIAYAHPEARIEAVTSVSGNVDIKHTTSNVLKILDILDADAIPVYAGASSALVAKSENASFVHGEDGMGDIGLPNSRRKVEEMPAAVALLKLAKENPGELSLIAIGPLTNLALSIHLEPNLPKLYKELVIMGGAHFSQGNTQNFPAEFNIYADPDAAHVVFEKWQGFRMVTWEATLAHGIPSETVLKLCQYDNPRSIFLNKLMSRVNIYKKTSKTKLSYFADPLAMAVMLEPDIVLESSDKYVQVERFGSLSRGMTVVDWWDSSQKTPNVNIVQKVDLERFIALFQRAFE